MTSTCSRSNGSESSESSGSSDQELRSLQSQAPLGASIGRALEKCIPTLPPEVHELLAAYGAPVMKTNLLKTSFHKTFLVMLHAPLLQEGASYTSVIVQILGSTMSSKAIFGPISSATITKASELATLAGIRVPKILATGQCHTTRLGSLDFVIEEFIETDTVEDEVTAPSAQWRRIEKEVQEKLCGMPLTQSDVHPLPYFSSLLAQLQWLLTVIPEWDDHLRGSFVNFTESVDASPPPHQPPVLVHQDINGGNLLCSRQRGTDEWFFDALIDWDTAVVVDPRFMSNREPWHTARAFSKVIQGAHLADLFVQGRLPRCDLGQMIEGYDKASTKLHQSSWLEHEVWASKVSRARTWAKHKHGVVTQSSPAKFLNMSSRQLLSGVFRCLGNICRSPK